MKKVGNINSNVIKLLGLSILPETPIYIGNSNTNHMAKKHPYDYAKYGADIPLILSKPDYVGLNAADGSIEYVKEYLLNDEFVKVAVRVSSGNRYYVRSLYTLNKNRVQNYINKGTLKKT